MPDSTELLAEIRDRVEGKARADPRTIIDGLLLSRHETSEPDYQLTEPLFILMVQGGKRLYLGQDVIEYRAGDCLIVTASIPLSGHFLDASRNEPALAMALHLRSAVIAGLVSELPSARYPWPAAGRGVQSHKASGELLDAVARLLRLLERQQDVSVMGPMLEREILWTLLTGPGGNAVAQIGLAESNLAHVSRAITWLRENFSRSIPVAELAKVAGMSPTSFYRHFRAISGFTPLQYQKHLRLQEARALLLARECDVTGAARSVGYGSPAQFNREYRRLFGAPPGRDTAALRAISQT